MTRLCSNVAQAARLHGLNAGEPPAPRIVLDSVSVFERTKRIHEW
jgi:hypothetical protein